MPLPAMNRYRYYNRNPDGYNIKDCVCRAISTATNLKYEAVERLLTLTSIGYSCEKLCLDCYSRLLEDILCYKRRTCRTRKTVEDIAAEYYNKTVIIRIRGHLTAAIHGYIDDTWDCSNKIVDCYWVID